VSFLPKQNDISALLNDYDEAGCALAKVKCANRRPSKLLPAIAVVPDGTRHFQD
jgi:hypothetical protein